MKLALCTLFALAALHCGGSVEPLPSDVIQPTDAQEADAAVDVSPDAQPDAQAACGWTCQPLAAIGPDAVVWTNTCNGDVAPCAETEARCGGVCGLDGDASAH